MARRSFDSLSPNYRERLIGAARSGTLTGTPVPAANAEAVARAYHSSGGDIRAAAGKAKPAARGSAPVRATRALKSRTTPTPEQETSLKKWRKSREYPKWLPRSEEILGTDTAALLSQIDIPPSQWKSAKLVARPDGLWNLTVTGPRGRRITVGPFDRDQVSELGKVINQAAREKSATSDAERKRLQEQWRKGSAAPTMVVNLSGTDEAAVAEMDPADIEALMGSIGAQRAAGGTTPPPPAPPKKAPGAKKAAAKKAPAKKKPAKKQPAKRAPAKKRAKKRAATGGFFDLVSNAIELAEEAPEQALALLEAQAAEIQRAIEELRKRL